MQPSGQLSASPNRIIVIDALRAFALFGIIVNHSAMAFLAGPPPRPGHLVFSSLDQFVADAVRLLTFGKFFAIFSFLFGLSFAIQLRNASRKNISFSGRFTWRLVVLLIIGFVHSLFFSGDILVIYAILGLLLVPFQKIGNRTLTVIALILILNIPGLLLGAASVSQPPSVEQQTAAAQGREEFIQRGQRQYQIKKHGTVSDVLAMNAQESFTNKLMFQIRTGRLWITFGLFLLGMSAGRLNLFDDTGANRTLFKRLLLWSAIVGMIATLIVIFLPISPRTQNLKDVFAAFSFSIQQAALAAFFVATFTLLFWKNPGGVLSKLAPTGKMGLTTYLLQTVFGLIVFFGFGLGLMGELGVAACVGLGIVFFVLQIFLARWWLTYFELGPIEWLWRSLTYFRVQPNLRSQVSAA